MVQKVDYYKETLAKQDCPQKQMQSKMTDFIAKQKSQQEFVPLVAKIIVENAHVEPLHFLAVLNKSIGKQHCQSIQEVFRCAC